MSSVYVIGLLMAFSSVLCQDEIKLGKQIVEANNRFAFDMYNAIKDEGNDNIFISPMSISTCMGMLYMMANGTTAREISDTMHFPKEHEGTALGFQQCLKGLDEEAFTWANNIFINKSFHVKQAFLDTLNNYWKAVAEKLDFSHEPKKSRDHINDWVSSKTNQMIKDLLPESFPEGDTAMVLVSALHFKRPWIAHFQNKTEKGTFHLANGKTVNVDVMYAEDSSFSIKRLKDIKADVLKIPYKGDKQSMLIFQPLDHDGLPALENELKQLDLNNLLKTMWSGVSVQVTMPKFKYEDSRKLKSPFQKLGLNRIFSSFDAEFTRASDNRNLEVSQIYHKAMIIVDEKGTEAAAATGNDEFNITLM
uniref:Venom serpin 4 n=1 Tax=Lethocerus distinctifemur TaxID=280095 RepID=A0A2K8JRI6_9HEMI|nr:venom serpin 4 [Lethocerus distinctifemur]